MMRFLPEILKEMLKNVPTLLFDVMDWKELTQVFPTLSKRIIARDLIKPLVAQISSTFTHYNIIMVDELPDQTSPLTNASDRDVMSKALLQSYFQQIFNKEGQILDFRSEHYKFKDQKIYWRPSGLWATWNEEFRLGLIQVYQGFFFEDEQLFRNGLSNIKLIQDNWNQADQDEMTSLFHNHFKSSLTENMVFNVAHFQESFLSIFHFLLKKKVRMSADFMYLGMMLVTLYLHLEELNSPLGVKEIFLRVNEKNQEIFT